MELSTSEKNKRDVTNLCCWGGGESEKNKGKGLGLILLKFIVHVLGDTFVLTTNGLGSSIKCYWNHLFFSKLVDIV